MGDLETEEPVLTALTMHGGSTLGCITCTRFIIVNTHVLFNARRVYSTAKMM